MGIFGNNGMFGGGAQARRPKEEPVHVPVADDDDDFMDISDVLGDKGQVAPMPDAPAPAPDAHSPKPDADANAAVPTEAPEPMPAPAPVPSASDAQPVPAPAPDDDDLESEDQPGTPAPAPEPQGQYDPSLPSQKDLMARLRTAVTDAQEARKQAEALQQQVTRIRADFDNYRRRMSEEKERNKSEAVSSAAKQLLPILDDFERSIDHYSNGTDAEKAMAEGNRNIYRHMLACLQKLGIEQVDPTGEEFDPNYAMAIQQSHEDKVEPGIVTATYLKGYRIGDRVVRTAQVCVSA